MNWEDSILLFKYTSRSRPKKFIEGLKSIIDNLDKPDKTKVLVTLDNNDPTHDEYQSLIIPFYDKVFIKVCSGESKNKINAINRDLNEFKGHWDILINMSDDMRFEYKGFDTVIRNHFTQHFPNGDGFIHYSDGFQHHNVCTMTIEDRMYYDRDKYIYHEDYVSLWCDCEATDIAKERGCYNYVNHSEIIIFKHYHPAWGLSEFDTQYQLTQDLTVDHKDRDTYHRRKANNWQ